MYIHTLKKPCGFVYIGGNPYYILPKQTIVVFRALASGRPTVFWTGRNPQNLVINVLEGMGRNPESTKKDR